MGIQKIEILKAVKENILDDYFNYEDYSVGVESVGGIDENVLRELKTFEGFTLIAHREKKVKFKISDEVFNIYLDEKSERWMLKEWTNEVEQEIKFMKERLEFKKGKSPMVIGREQKVLDKKWTHPEGIYSDRDIVEKYVGNDCVQINYFDNKYWLKIGESYKNISKIGARYFDMIRVLNGKTSFFSEI
ncbi:hypothetical protein [Bacillus phage SPbetaL8]|nr:hypothetical protein [Bacillus phage SPbetaL8]